MEGGVEYRVRETCLTLGVEDEQNHDSRKIEKWVNTVRELSDDLNDVARNFILLEVDNQRLVSKKWQDRSHIYLKLVFCWVTGNNNIFDANLFNCVQINDDVKQADKSKKRRK